MRKKTAYRTSSNRSFGHRVLLLVKMTILRTMELRALVAATEENLIRRWRTIYRRSSDGKIRVSMNLTIFGPLNNSNSLMTLAALKTSQEMRVADLVAEIQIKAARCKVKMANLLLETHLDAEVTKPIKDNLTT